METKIIVEYTLKELLNHLGDIDRFCIGEDIRGEIERFKKLIKSGRLKIK